MLKGDDGFQGKEIEKLVHWLSGLPRFDLAVLPNSLLIALAAPLKRALRLPIGVSLQGEDLFLEGLPEPWRAEAKDLIRRHASDVDGFISISDYYAGFMAGYLGLPRERIHVVPLGIRLDGHAPRGVRRPDAPFTLGYLARVAPEKGLDLLARAYVILRRERGLPPVASRGRGISRARAPRIPRAGARSPARTWASKASSRIAGTVDRAEKIAFLQGTRRASPSRVPMRSPRACTSSRPWPTACPWWRRGTARCRSWSKPRAAACS